MDLDGAQRCFKFLKNGGLQHLASNYLLVIGIRELQSGVELLRKKSNTSMICGMLPKELSKKIMMASKGKGSELLAF